MSSNGTLPVPNNDTTHIVDDIDHLDDDELHKLMYGTESRSNDESSSDDDNDNNIAENASSESASHTTTLLSSPESTLSTDKSIVDNITTTISSDNPPSTFPESASTPSLVPPLVQSQQYNNSTTSMIPPGEDNTQSHNYQQQCYHNTEQHRPCDPSSTLLPSPLTEPSPHIYATLPSGPQYGPHHVSSTASIQYDTLDTLQTPHVPHQLPPLQQQQQQQHQQQLYLRPFISPIPPPSTIGQPLLNTDSAVVRSLLSLTKGGQHLCIPQYDDNRSYQQPQQDQQHQQPDDDMGGSSSHHQQQQYNTHTTTMDDTTAMLHEINAHYLVQLTQQRYPQRAPPPSPSPPPPPSSLVGVSNPSPIQSTTSSTSSLVSPIGTHRPIPSPSPGGVPYPPSQRSPAQRSLPLPSGGADGYMSPLGSFNLGASL